MKDKPSTLGIIGTGATTVFILKNICTQASLFKSVVETIILIEKDEIMGMGMPYNPGTTDIYHLANITSEEIPGLNQSFASWLREQDDEFLVQHGILREEIAEDEVYGRLALGEYFRAQYRCYLDKLIGWGFKVYEYSSEEVTDIVPGEAGTSIIAASGKCWEVDKLIISTGHFWKEQDVPERHYYATPWPISKLIPQDGCYHNFTVGIMGASLSAFDVVTSLARRHGTFRMEGGKTIYIPFEGTGNFKVVLHDAKGWLPQLQYEQAECMREIYRHVSREQLMSLLTREGKLKIADYFDKVCRPALQQAFARDQMPKQLQMLNDPDFGFEDFIKAMSQRHNYSNAFEGLREELEEAMESARHKKPVHWKEVTDDLMYCLNFHAELLPAEDHIFLQTSIMPFLLNVIAALPLRSANILLALYEAGKLELKSGTLEIPEEQNSKEHTSVKLMQDGKEQLLEYRMFVVCGGQGAVEAGDFPFPGLLRAGAVRPAMAKFRYNPPQEEKVEPERLFYNADGHYYLLGGIDIDAAYNIIDVNGSPNDSISDVSFTHYLGLRPYSYGLQACAATAGIMVDHWVKAIEKGGKPSGDIMDVSRTYRDDVQL